MKKRINHFKSEFRLMLSSSAKINQTVINRRSAIIQLDDINHTRVNSDDIMDDSNSRPIPTPDPTTHLTSMIAPQWDDTLLATLISQSFQSYVVKKLAMWISGMPNCLGSDHMVDSEIELLKLIVGESKNWEKNMNC